VGAPNLILRDIVDDDGFAVLADFIANGRLDFQLPAGLEAKPEVVHDIARDPPTFRNPSDGSEAHSRRSAHNVKDGRHRRDATNCINIRLKVVGHGGNLQSVRQHISTCDCEVAYAMELSLRPRLHCDDPSYLSTSGCARGRGRAAAPHARRRRPDRGRVRDDRSGQRHGGPCIASGNIFLSREELPNGAKFLPKPYDMRRVIGAVRELAAVSAH